MGYNVTPSATTSATNRNYINSQVLSTAYSSVTIEKPSVYDELVRGFGSGNISTFLKMMDRESLTDNPVFIHGEKDWIRDVIKVAASSGHGAGAAVTLTVASAYRDSVSNSAAPEYSASGSTTNIMPIAQDVIQVPNGSGGFVECLVTAVSGNDFTIYPVVTGETVPNVTASTEIIRTGTAVKEGSSATSSRSTQISSYTNNVQRMRDYHEVTGTALSSVTWLNNLGEDGNGNAWYLEGIRDVYINHQNDCEFQMLTSQKITNATLTAVSGQGTTIKTEGYIPFVESNGQREQYTEGSWSLTDLENMVKKLYKYKGSTENALWVGHNLSIEIDNVMRNSEGLKAGGIQYAGVGGEERSVKFGFNSFTYGDISFHKKTLEAFTSPVVFGADGFKYANMGLVIPMDNTIVAKDGTNSASTTVPSLRMECLDRPDMTNGYREWVTGGAGLDDPTDGDDVMKVHLLSEKGLHAFAGHRHGQFYV